MYFIGLVFGMVKLLQVAHISSGRRNGVFRCLFSVITLIVSGKLTEHPANEPIAIIAQSVRLRVIAHSTTWGQHPESRKK
jgi:hypothetical protein